MLSMPALQSLTLALLILVVGFASAAQAEPIRSKPIAPQRKPTERNPKEVLEAVKKFEAGYPEEAFELLKKAAAAHKFLPPPRVMFANFYLTENQFAAGRAQLEQATQEHPGDPEPHFSFGDLAVRDGRLSDAEAQYLVGGKLLEKYQGDASRRADLTAKHRLGLASVAASRGKFDQTEKSLRALVAEQPQNLQALQHLGGALACQGKIPDALAQFQAAIGVDTSLPPAPMMAAKYVLGV